MSLTNPMVIAINGTNYNLARIRQSDYLSEYFYRGTVFELTLIVRHSKEKRNADGVVFDRHNIELTQTVFATSTTPKIVRQAYSVFRNDELDDATNASYLYQGLIDVSTDANLGDLIAWIN